jgi:shikimate kinase
MASGKSVIGGAFASKLKRPFFDCDELIEAHAGKSITEIFAQDGESRFREIETEMILKCAKQKDLVVSLGGGAVVNKSNWQIIVESGLTICLFAKEEVLYERISQKTHRPLMANKSPNETYLAIQELLKKREKYYSKANYSFENSGVLDPQQMAEFIYCELKNES